MLLFVDCLGRLSPIALCIVHYLHFLLLPFINTFTMFTAVKEIIWHLTCTNCKNWFTYATMEDRLCIDRFTFHCPHCGKSGGVKKDSKKG